MDYPNNFDIPAFPAGRSVAFSRTVSIWIAIISFLIICACGFILLMTHVKRNYPFLISVDPITSEWTVVAYPDKESKDSIPQTQIIQEKLVNDFVNNWFTISSNMKTNESRWEKCSIEFCDEPQQFNPNNIECAIFCTSDAKLFDIFSKDVLPEYKSRIREKSETWTVRKKDIMKNLANDNGSRWQVLTTIHSSVSGDFDVLIFVQIKRDTEEYPATMGYYVSDFNAYRINK